MTPTCHNRPKLTAYLHPSGELIPHRMSQPCKSWSTGDRATPVPVLEGWQCAGCRWLPRADVLRFAQITTDPQLMRELTELAGVVECWCERCDMEQASSTWVGLFLRFRMNLCPICGNKRCPRAADHRNECATELAKSSETVAGEADRMTGVKADVIRTFGDSRLRVYISGPMTGYPNLNRPAFAMAAEKVEAAGMIPVNPHDLCEPNWDWHQCMRADVSALCGCDAILMIDGWHCSNGAQLELHIAHRIGLRVLLNWHDVIDFAGRK